ncbi:MAG TPA: c-type cytochrome [Gaiellales bacterium]|nr:c-type cytochrome [Gaiellales bacterium]
MSTDRASEGLTGAFVFAAIAIVLVIVGVAVTAWLGGRANASGRTATVVRTAGAGGTQTTASNVSPIVAAGAHDYNQFACAQYHGIGGVGGVSADVPALNRLGTAFTVAELRQIIEHGLGESANPTKPYMPVWHGIVSPRQVSELAAYIRAGLPPVSGATPVAVPTDQGPAVEGSALYVRDGCVNCHGPNGLGGVPNPQSPDRTIPPLSGADFRNEFNTPAKIANVIRSGSVIGRAPIVSMPHWGGILPAGDVRALIAYLATLQ